MTAVIDPAVTSSHSPTEAPQLDAPEGRRARKRIDQRLPESDIGDRLQQQVSRLSLVRTTRTTAVGITIVIATASFVL
jgi:hypothetical protein